MISKSQLYQQGLIDLNKDLVAKIERLKAELERKDKQLTEQIKIGVKKSNLLQAELSKAQEKIKELEPLAEIGRAIKVNDKEVQKFIDELKESSKVDPKDLDEPATI